MAKIMIGRYEGSIYREGDGWTGAISLGFGPDGKRKRLKRKGKTKTEVKDKLRQAVEDLDKRVKPDHRYSVEDAVNDFLTAFDKTGSSPETKKAYRSLADHQIIPFLGRIRLKDLTADDVETWLKGRTEHLTSSSLGIVHGLLKRSIRRAARHDKVARNVAELVDTPEGKSARKSRSLTLEQANAVLAEAAKSEHRLGAYVTLAIVTGLRTEELRKLTWSAVDLDSATLYVLRAERHRGETKTPLSRRGLGIAQLGVEALRALKRRQAAEKLKAGDAYKDRDLVFCDEYGAPYTAQQVRRHFRKILDAAGLKGADWVPRELRHTFVSLMSDHGVPVEKISVLVGHKTTRVTETVYRHQIRPEIRDGAEHMNEIFPGKAVKSA
ncbi:site-specific integrase [Actinomadura sp. NBRC 104425]|uniref:tyrosine-type recombinase/integrase n=1 Tax=Actinomadura sp. NBRC 104425 TaxID=3032204 RepID=UPI0024A2960E|nr:tyrosine-type recombinase/integrase [Actinomadura sp. NBRC 104425]GLZ13286.1 site-specific integrase [Actinomadura sp. NBRC 104425]